MEEQATVDGMASDRGRRGGPVAVLGELDVRLGHVEDAARSYVAKMLEADRARANLAQRLKDAQALNEVRPYTVSDQQLADRVNQAIPKGARALGRRLQVSNMTVRRLTGKAPMDSRPKKNP